MKRCTYWVIDTFNPGDRHGVDLLGYHDFWNRDDCEEVNTDRSSGLTISLAVGMPLRQYLVVKSTTHRRHGPLEHRSNLSKHGRILKEPGTVEK